MGEASYSALRILEEFRRDGLLAEESSVEADWEDHPTRVTPGLLLLIATRVLFKARQERGAGPVESPVLLAQGIGRDEIEKLIAALAGDLSAVQAVRDSGLVTLRHFLALLVTFVNDEALDDGDVTDILITAEEFADEFLRAEDPFHMTVRGVDTGPWDVSEQGWRGSDLIDLGGLRIPRELGLRVDLSGAASGVPLEAVITRGRTGLQL
ncbi:hypothetical protein [Kitasatospora sp. NPDC086791]|uniref:hypothetical protein n=1 Tax=Kitasatospora sp. NPDC086791 TaxID=3155178 RepID=UPI003433F583